jgi:choline dehydrogenase-like flavoprotein
MFLDARTIPRGTTLEADICIAGAGAAGITLARDLRGTGLSVLVIESGGFEPDGETQLLNQGRMIGIDTWSLQRMRRRALGGTTGMWSGWCRPLLRHDLERRDYVPGSGWPIGYDDLIPWYERACETLQIGPFVWDAAARAKAVRKPLLPVSGALEHRYYQFSPPTRFGEVYRADLETSRDVRLVLRGTVTDVRLERALDRVSSFTCRTLAGGTFHVNAGRYVLALGGIENARVLLASRSQQREGVANGHDVVGRYFMEHPHYFGSVGLIHFAKLDLRFFDVSRSDLAHSSGPRARVRVQGAIGLSPEVARAEKLLGFSATFMKVPPSAQWGALAPSSAQALLTRGAAPFEGARLVVRAEQSPIAESRLTLTDERDALDMPRVALDWRIAADDDVRLRRALVILGRELAAAGVARAWIPGDGSRFVWKPTPGGHHMGTTRMGTDPAASVVDANCRTHQTGNLYIAGSSVFPTTGDSNPTLTIVALAHRLAQTLKDAS